MEVYVDDETKLTLHGLQQYYVKLKDNEKNRKLFDLLDLLEFNQVRVYTLCAVQRFSYDGPPAKYGLPSLHVWPLVSRKIGKWCLFGLAILSVNALWPLHGPPENTNDAPNHKLVAVWHNSSVTLLIASPLSAFM